MTERQSAPFDVVVGAPVHEAPTELDLRERNLAKAGEARIPHAEIVDRQRDVVNLQLRADGASRIDIAQGLILGDLQDEPGPAIAFRGELPDYLDQWQIDDLMSGNVDRKA